MVQEGFITQSEADTAAQEQLTFNTNTTDIKAPHFVMYIKDLLAQQYGEDAVNQGGLIVKTSLDLSLQNQVQQAVTDEVLKLKNLRVSNGASLVTNPQTGEILAMVGSVDYFDFSHDGQVNVTLRPRQPGSSIKPLTYALALERGKTPSSTILDAPVTFHIPGSPSYTPKNYDGRYHGTVTLRQALANSYNIPAVKTLAEVGVNNMIDKAKTMGITTWEDRTRFGLALTLGGGEVLMSDMAVLYGTFANNGYTVPLNPILEIQTADGINIYTNTCAQNHDQCSRTKTLDPRVAAQITDILSDNNARSAAFGLHSVLTIPGQQVAVKTGTTNNLKDNWTFGYTSDHLVATWVGNNDGQTMSGIASGITGASPIWNTVMRFNLSDEHPHTFAAPAGLIKVAVCTSTGTLPCQGCPAIRDEYFIAGTEPTNSCQPSWFQKKPAANRLRDQILDSKNKEIGG